MERAPAGVRPISDGGAAGAPGLGWEFRSANASGLVPSRDAKMWCCGPWACRLLVGTDVRWTDCYRTAGRSKRQVRFMELFLLSLDPQSLT